MTLADSPTADGARGLAHPTPGLPGVWLTRHPGCQGFGSPDTRVARGLAHPTPGLPGFSRRRQPCSDIGLRLTRSRDPWSVRPRCRTGLRGRVPGGPPRAVTWSSVHELMVMNQKIEHGGPPHPRGGVSAGAGSKTTSMAEGGCPDLRPGDTGGGIPWQRGRPGCQTPGNGGVRGAKPWQRGRAGCQTPGNGGVRGAEPLATYLSTSPTTKNIDPRIATMSATTVPGSI